MGSAQGVIQPLVSGPFPPGPGVREACLDKSLPQP
jgi:hypothetical protein